MTLIGPMVYWGVTGPVVPVVMQLLPIKWILAVADLSTGMEYTGWLISQKAMICILELKQHV